MEAEPERRGFKPRMNTDGHGSAALGVAAAACLRRGYGGRACRGLSGAHESRRLFRRERTFIANFTDRADEWDDGVPEENGAKRTRFSRITVPIDADTWGSFVAGVRRPRPMPAIGQPKAVRKAPDLNRRFRGWRRCGKKRPDLREGQGHGCGAAVESSELGLESSWGHRGHRGAIRGHGVWVEERVIYGRTASGESECGTQERGRNCDPGFRFGVTEFVQRCRRFSRGPFSPVNGCSRLHGVPLKRKLLSSTGEGPLCA